MSPLSKTASVQLRHILVQAKHWNHFPLAAVFLVGLWGGGSSFFFSHLVWFTAQHVSAPCSSFLYAMLQMTLGRLGSNLLLKTCTFWEVCGNACCVHDLLAGWPERWPWGTPFEKIPPDSRVSTIPNVFQDPPLSPMSLKTPEGTTYTTLQI